VNGLLLPCLLQSVCVVLSGYANRWRKSSQPSASWSTSQVPGHGDVLAACSRYTERPPPFSGAAPQASSNVASPRRSRLIVFVLCLRQPGFGTGRTRKHHIATNSVAVRVQGQLVLRPRSGEAKSEWGQAQLYKRLNASDTPEGMRLAFTRIPSTRI